MYIFNKSFDTIVSLGGSCATAKQLKFKKLRKCSYPFDWLFHNNNEALCYLIKAFETDFSDWMKRDKLIPLKYEERGDSPLNQYHDLNTGFNTIHDFHKPVEDDEEYNAVITKYKRRISRLLDHISKSKHTLLILDARYPVCINCLADLKKVIESKYPNDVVQVLLFQFNASENAYYENEWLAIRKMTRNHSNLEYNGEPCEWDILKEITLTSCNSVEQS